MMPFRLAALCIQVFVLPLAVEELHAATGVPAAQAPGDDALASAAAWLDAALPALEAGESIDGERFDGERLVARALEHFGDRRAVFEHDVPRDVCVAAALERAAEWWDESSFAALRRLDGEWAGDGVRFAVWDAGSEDPWRVDVARVGDTWRLVDAERLDTGWSLGLEAAAAIVARAAERVRLDDTHRFVPLCAELTSCLGAPLCWNEDTILERLAATARTESDWARVRSMGAVAVAYGNDDERIEAIVDAGVIEPQLDRALGLWLVEQGRSGEARERLERWCERVPHDARALGAWALTLADANDHAGALAAVTRACEVAGGSPETLLLFDALAGSTGEERVLAWFPDTWLGAFVFPTLVERWRARGSHESVRRLAQLARGRFPLAPLPPLEESRALLELGRAAEAEALVRSARARAEANGYGEEYDQVHARAVEALRSGAVERNAADAVASGVVESTSEVPTDSQTPRVDPGGDPTRSRPQRDAGQNAARARPRDVMGIPVEERHVDARAWLERAIEDINDGLRGYRHFGASWVVGNALGEFPDEERARAAIPVRLRMRIGAQEIAEWCAGDSFGRLRVVASRYHPNAEILHLWDDEAHEPWIMWVDYLESERAWRIEQVIHVPSSWRLTFAIAGELVEPLGRTVDLRDDERGMALRAKAFEAARDWRFDEIDPYLVELRELDLPPDDRADVRGLATMVEIERGFDETALVPRADMGGAHGSARRAVCLALVAAGVYEPARASLETWTDGNPWDAEAVGALAKVVAAGGDRSRAIELVERAGAVTEWAPEELLVLDAVLGTDGEAEVRARCDASKHAARGFESLAEHWFHGERRDSAVRLIEARRERAPDDPNVAWYRSWLLGDEGRHADAALLLLQAFPGAERNGELGLFQRAFVEEMLAGGKGLEGYRMADRTAPGFEALAEEWASEGAWAQLLSLCDEHERAGGPAVPLDAWRARAHAALGAHAEALLAARRALADVSLAPEPRRACEDVLVRALLRERDWLAVYDESDPPGEWFEALASALLEAHDGDALAELVEHHRARGAGSAALAPWECDVLFLRAPSSVALAAFEERRAALVAADPPRSLLRWQDRATRLLVREGQLDRAMTLALEIDAETGDSLYLAIAHLAGARPLNALPALRRCLDGARTPAVVLGDPDVARGLARPQAAAVRAWLETRDSDGR